MYEAFSADTRLAMKYPTGLAEAGEVLYPSFQKLEPDYAAAIAISPVAKETLLVLSPTGNATVNATLSAAYVGGERLTIKVVSDASARTITLGTGITGPALTTTANKTHCADFVFDGAGFVQVSAWVTID